MDATGRTAGATAESVETPLVPHPQPVAAAPRALHLLTVWNPTYSGDALDAHLAVLLDWARRHEAGEAAPDDVYVWWGKIRSTNRNGPLPHHSSVLAIDRQSDSPTETHLYLTDYRSLYVADLGEVTDQDVREMSDEIAHMPAYYADHAIDFWFRLFDIRRLITDDTPAVIEELKTLRNTAYHDRPVSLYGGVVDLPLVVYREPEALWFSDRNAMTDGRLWAERAAAHRSEAERISRELRDNLFGRELWPRLAPATRSFLASAEAVFRSRRDDAAFDVSGVAVEYAKAVEAELNALLFPALRRALGPKSPQERHIRVDARTLDLGGIVPHQTLGTIRNLLLHEGMVHRGVRIQLRQDYAWVLGVLPKLLAKLVDVRNRSAHSHTTSGDELAALRRQVLGIGEEGLLATLVRVGMRAVG